MKQISGVGQLKGRRFDWSALEDDFRTFLLNTRTFEPALSAIWD
jgi:hypothetical protein